MYTLCYASSQKICHKVNYKMSGKYATVKCHLQRAGCDVCPKTTRGPYTLKKKGNNGSQKKTTVRLWLKYTGSL